MQMAPVDDNVFSGDLEPPDFSSVAKRERLFEAMVTEDSRQQAEWLVRGRYPVAIGTASAQLLRLERSAK